MLGMHDHRPGPRLTLPTPRTLVVRAGHYMPREQRRMPSTSDPSASRLVRGLQDHRWLHTWHFRQALSNPHIKESEYD